MPTQTLKQFNDLSKEIIEEYANKIEGSCICGEKVTLVTESNLTNRKDGRRFYYSDNDTNICLFRCKCGKLIQDSFKQ